MPEFTLYWKDGKREVIKGETTISQAFSSCGYGGGAIRALDFHCPGDNKEYEWDSNSKNWIRKLT